MGRTWSVYIAEEELNERIDKALEEDRFHNQAHLFISGVKEILDDENESTDQLV